ncbi:MAG: hypothetical protein LLG06_15805 [Desulfobacteraceae bacterium]|nr:hypothetical protein [Desulfobacteraceae bacterium]
MYVRLASILLMLFLALASVSFAEDEAKPLDPSLVPMDASGPAGFVPEGWEMEDRVSGDLNNDSLTDYALKIVEKKKSQSENPEDRQRALVIVFGKKDGKLSRAAVAPKLLQCTGCGGAFYGVSDAPADIKIKKGVLIVEQSNGSRSVNYTTCRFRHEPESGKFLLIGFDFSEHDRLDDSEISESTNYLTGVRIVTQTKGKKKTSRQKSVPTEKIDIEQIDYDQFAASTVERLGL